MEIRAVDVEHNDDDYETLKDMWFGPEDEFDDWYADHFEEALDNDDDYDDEDRDADDEDHEYVRPLVWEDDNCYLIVWIHDGVSRDPDDEDAPDAVVLVSERGTKKELTKIAIDTISSIDTLYGLKNLNIVFDWIKGPGRGTDFKSIVKLMANRPRKHSEADGDREIAKEIRTAITKRYKELESPVKENCNMQEDYDEYYNDDNCKLVVSLSFSLDSYKVIFNKKGSKEELTKELINIINSIDDTYDLDALDVSFNWLEDNGEESDVIFSIYSVFTDEPGDGPGDHEYIYNDDEVAEEIIQIISDRYDALEGAGSADVDDYEESLTEANNNYNSNKAKNALVNKYADQYADNPSDQQERKDIKARSILHHINGNHNEDTDLANDVLIVADNREDAKLAHKLLHLLSYCYIREELERKLNALGVEFYFHPDYSGKPQPIDLKTLVNGLVEHDKRLRDIALIDEDEEDLDALGHNNFELNN